MTGRSGIRIRPRQSLGQNFLTDDNIVRNIVRDLRITGDDVVLEIGPGLGALTKAIVGRVRHLILVEIDARAVAILEKEFGGAGVTILHKDCLDISFREWAARFKATLRIVGNLPYHLTSPILFKVFDEHDAVRDLTVMVQREVAQRLVAERGTKDYGILTVMTQLHGSARSLFNVSPNCFFPKPNVTSSVIQLTIEQTRTLGVDEQLLRTVVRTAFGKRRKMLRNSLTYLPYDPPVIDQLLETMKIPASTRPEQLMAGDFIALTQLLKAAIATAALQSGGVQA